MRTQTLKATTFASNQSGISNTKAIRDQVHEAQAALHFWQALEYLAPQTPPDVNAADFVWELDKATPDAKMPWWDPIKQAILKKEYSHWRFQIFSGIVNGSDLVEEARAALGAQPIDMSERKPPSPAACVVLEVNGAGMATGQVFVSTVPWAMSRIVEHAGKTTHINFRGFLGNDGLGEKIRAQIGELLIERKLLPPAGPAEDIQPPTAPNGDASAHLAFAAPTQLGQSAPVAGTADTAGRAATHGSQDGSGAGALAPATAPLRPITAADIEAITDLVFSLCNWCPERQIRWRIQGIKASEKGSEAGKAQDDPLNSFYAEDLERVCDALAANNIGVGLREYLRGEDAPGRIDLERNVDKLIRGVHPSWLPHGCWPAKHPLVTAQQFAVNTMMRELSGSSGIFSVNGPPGTGKTTMLKDIVAAGVVSRADVLVTIKDPESAFKHRLEIENYDFAAYRIDERLRGFGMVVASANNGAVENITKELPGLNAIAPGLQLDYFSIVADSLAAPEKASKRSEKQERWGLIAAVLGNKGNRNQFASRFWFAGLPPKPKKGEENKPPEPPDPLRLRSVQSLVKTGEHGALPWEDARKRYIAAQEKVQTLIDQATEAACALPKIRAAGELKQSTQTALKDLLARMPELQATVSLAVQEEVNAAAVARRVLARLNACRAIQQLQEEADRVETDLIAWESKMPGGGLPAVTTAHARAVTEHRDLRQQYNEHIARQPSFLSQLFRTEFSKRWNALGEKLEKEIDDACAHEKSAKELVARAEALTQKIANVRAALQSTQDKVQQARTVAELAGVTVTDTVAVLELEYQTSLKDAASQHNAALRAKAFVDATECEIRKCGAIIADADAEIDQESAILGALKLSESELGTWDPTQLSRDNLHRASPYAMQALFNARREVFIAAMELHKAFIVAAWRKLGPTLGAFVNVLSGGISPGQVSKGVIYLWDAFFLIVPLISTTFASFPRLFSGIGREELAWLLIDEAGQATPQQAVGAIWRSKRSIIVGDPLQLEPVVGVPDEIVAPLLARCSAEKQWAPPAASAQVLADRANRYGTYLGEEGEDDTVWLGSPLVVHRRCLNPMFGISNSIAYDDMMVYGAGDDNGEAGIGPSCWFHVPANQSDGHWIEAQGQMALALVQKITGGVLAINGQHKVYVITPFKQVANKIGDLLFAHYKAASRGMSGTVHTFQGKEAEHVIFLLGGNPTKPGVISSFAGARPNLVNVAVTRAKRRLYVIGDHTYWTGPADIHRIYRRMAKQLSVEKAD